MANQYTSLRALQPRVPLDLMPTKQSLFRRNPSHVTSFSISLIIPLWRVDEGPKFGTFSQISLQMGKLGLAGGESFGYLFRVHPRVLTAHVPSENAIT
ncbi:hypothetical protein TNIN_71601 [Trichonephila inaurata madagascariensis]|uniref:Uncharacterized protein n=1 Tax=Trichonephila inaurata madagascariensis TaxID=2747483 RepID=A0A8X6XN86_9ARAC|nr:hypothetical protein TNIN_71601 [Trichonephila inaurata madagascariensis]